MDQEFIEALEQAFVELRVLVGAVQDPGTSEDLPPGVELSGLDRFNGAEPSNPVCDLLLFQFELGDLLIPFFLDGCFIHSVIVAHANLDERLSEISAPIHRCATWCEKQQTTRQLRGMIATVMAIYHFNAQIVSRSTGASAVAGAAYRSGEKLTDERTGETHDYRRRDDLDGTEIMTPREAPEWAQDRARLWNEVEAAERRKDAQVAREVRVAIPRELRQEERRQLVRDFAQSAFVDRGMVADIAYHGGKGENPHAHVMLTTRKLTQEGFGQKDRSWNSKELLASWRKGWAEHANQALERAGRGERIDHRTLVVQRDEAVDRGDLERAEKLDRDPEIHLGRAAWMMARSGEWNERISRNNGAAFYNKAREYQREEGRSAIREIQKEIQQVIRWAAEQIRNLSQGWEMNR